MAIVAYKCLQMDLGLRAQWWWRWWCCRCRWWWWNIWAFRYKCDAKRSVRIASICFILSGSRVALLHCWVVWILARIGFVWSSKLNGIMCMCPSSTHRATITNGAVNLFHQQWLTSAMPLFQHIYIYTSARLNRLQNTSKADDSVDFKSFTCNRIIIILSRLHGSFFRFSFRTALQTKRIE